MNPVCKNDISLKRCLIVPGLPHTQGTQGIQGIFKL